MDVKNLIKEIDFRPKKEIYQKVKKEVEDFIEKLEEEITKQKIEADVFIGGSFAKGTIVEAEEYEVDIFIRFGWKYEDLSDRLEKIVKAITKNIDYERIHGSRDYFMIKRRGISFELIPVTKIAKPKEARNVMDLSYFHVRYVKREIAKKKLERDVVLAKKFFKAIKVYGAESYVRGFSGYGVECLIIAYGGFYNMIKRIAESKDKIVLDPEKHYKNRESIMIEMNEARLNSPIILVDPTFKERNVLAGLGEEKFLLLKEKAKKFLKQPKKEYFEIKNYDRKEFDAIAKKNKGEYVEILLESDRQRGDIAGAKMRKYSDYLENSLGKYFEIGEKIFEYLGERGAIFGIIVKSKGEIAVIGPPLENKKACVAFRKAHGNAFKKNGYLHYKIKIKENCADFVKKMYEKESEKAKNMGIISLKVNP